MTKPPADPRELARTVTEDVFLTLLDGAGNKTGPVRVRDVEWVATLGGKLLGNNRPNPHRLELRPVAEHPLLV